AAGDGVFSGGGGAIDLRRVRCRSVISVKILPGRICKSFCAQHFGNIEPCRRVALNFFVV
ncbi:hypothetical protein QN362_16830, partial [Actimicrobium sp. CCC2.4]|uniref:hypothetical protein n=1 Tax=Actimicrobium sp. CCC2.4 TaxID=3048606 RepID=UPI002B24E709